MPPPRPALRLPVPRRADMLLHGNFIANKRAAMLAAHCAGATAASAAPPPPPPTTACSATSAPAAKPAAVFGASVDEMTDSCRYGRRRAVPAAAARCL